MRHITRKQAEGHANQYATLKDARYSLNALKRCGVKARIIETTTWRDLEPYSCYMVQVIR